MMDHRVSIGGVNLMYVGMRRVGGLAIDNHDLGIVTGCQGIGCDVAIETREEGGNQFFVHKLPGRMTFSNITLTRPIDESTSRVAQWISNMAVEPKRSTGSIEAKEASGRTIASWGLIDVIPVKWKGPQMSSEGGSSNRGKRSRIASTIVIVSSTDRVVCDSQDTRAGSRTTRSATSAAARLSRKHSRLTSESAM